MWGLRRRWLTNTVGLVMALAVVSVIGITAIFSAYYYSNVESDMKYRASSTADFFANYIGQSYKEYYQSCVTYAQTDRKSVV